MNVALVLKSKYPDLAGWQTEDHGDGEKIVKWPKGVKEPNEEELQKWWDEEVSIELERERIAAEREQRYRAETDGLLYDALAKLDAPELAEWKQAREAIKGELPYVENTRK